MEWNRRRKCPFAGMLRFDCVSGESETLVKACGVSIWINYTTLLFRISALCIPVRAAWVPEEKAHMRECIAMALGCLTVKLSHLSTSACWHSFCFIVSVNAACSVLLFTLRVSSEFYFPLSPGFRNVLPCHFDNLTNPSMCFSFV